MSKPKLPGNASFAQHVRDALRHFEDAAWLGRHSPLAEPYLLAALHTSEALGSPEVRGRLLRALLRGAALQLWDAAGSGPRDSADLLAARDVPGTARYHLLVLELNFFRTAAWLPRIPKTQAEIYTRLLHISRASHDRHLQAAVSALAQALLLKLAPPRATRPPLPPANWVQRADAQSTCMAALQRGAWVNLIGASGLGKSALAAWLMTRWQSDGRDACWLALRAGVNTSVQSLVFALGSHLQQARPSALFAQCVALEGRPIPPPLALALLRQDLAQRPPLLLVIDECDALLQDAANGPALAGFLDLLRDAHCMPVLACGVQVAVPGQVDCVLEAFDAAQSRALLQPAAGHLTNEQLTEMLRITGGNPRLLQLFGSAPDLAVTFGARPSIPVLVRNAMARLPANHQQLLSVLALFQQPAPREAFANAREAVDDLQQKGWLHAHSGGAIALSEMLAAAIAQHAMANEARLACGFAADVFLARGDVLAGASHAAQAGQFERAIDAIESHLTALVNWGAGGQALRVLDGIPPARLTKLWAQRLRLAQAALNRALGRVDEVLALATEALRSAALPNAVSQDMVRFLHHLGWAQEQTGNVQAAKDAYERARANNPADALIAARTTTSVGLARLALRERDLGTARREANRAAYEAAYMLGMVADEAGETDAAEAHLNRALELAEAAGDGRAVAFASLRLGVVLGRRGDDAAAAWLARAQRTFEHSGDRLQAENCRSNVSALLNSQGRHAAALEPGERALKFFVEIKHAQFVSATAATLADASVRLGKLEDAERHAQLILAQEESGFAPYALFSLAEVAGQRGELPRAIDLFQQVLAIVRESGDRYMQAHTERGLGRALGQLGNHAQARQHLQTAQALFEALKMTRDAGETRELLTRRVPVE